MVVAFLAVAANVPLKFALAPHFGAPGLALATSVGAWINFLSLYVLAHRAGVSRPDRDLVKTLIVVVAAALALAAAILICDAWLAPFIDVLPRFQRETRLAVLALVGCVTYAGVLLAAAWAAGLSLRR